ncbi:uncharacterized protein LOC130686907 [Daphnia carinata]|uniref:uncharacterized protein LOC130686907 n=1 Tax=Daphnia carinata TaxID=120202 RepID=UPI00257985C1|nr:uncharacterized protein LOC130686907 [Daphnia carinata]
MRFFIVDHRHFLPKDCRLITICQVLKETAILGRASSWAHFGISTVGENMYTDVLFLQDMKHMSLFVFNKAFDDLSKIICNNNAVFGANLAEKKQKLLSNITFALQSAMEQFKEVKGTKQKKLLVTIITVKWGGNVEREVADFFCSNEDATSNQIQIIEITSDNSLKDVMFKDKIRIFSLPTKGLDISFQAICKAKTRSSNLTISFPNSDLSIIAKVDLLIDFRSSRREQTQIPQNLTIISYAYLLDMWQIRTQGQCLLLSCSDVDTPNYHRWEALSKLAQNNGTILMATEHNTLSNYVLIPCSNRRILMQPMACSELLLPTTNSKTSELISKDFEAVTQNCELIDRYGFGPKSNLISHLMNEWKRQMPYHSADSTNPKQRKQKAPTKKPLNQPQLKKIASLAHPALGMYQK